ncbi:MAG: carboxymuconolactone decarboxylase family protein [Burkholderiaceae bacterium]|nr:carboxymuconolactone decarboxylase family protein [Burkholderiaceae bacterium]
MQPVIPYVDASIVEPAALVDAIRRRRGGHLINLDRMLLHSIPFARGWNAFLGEVRRNLSISPKLREIAMCGVAVLNGAEYEFIHHAPELLAAGGTQQQVDQLRAIGDPTADFSMFSALEQDVIRLTWHMTREIAVPMDLTQRLQQALGPTQLVEMVGVIAAYNMVSRFLIALGVTPED